MPCRSMSSLAKAADERSAMNIAAIVFYLFVGLLAYRQARTLHRMNVASIVFFLFLGLFLGLLAHSLAMFWPRLSGR